jgi:hypothetical protein
VLALIHLFSENPSIVVSVISMITALTVFPVYFLSYYVTKKKELSLIASIFVAFSYEQITTGTWLSNPAFGVIALPLFMYFWVRLADHFEYKNMFWTMFFLGLSVQFVISDMLWCIAPITLFIYQLNVQKGHFEKKQIKIWFMGITTFVTTILSMIVAELIMMKRGILTLSSLTTFNMGSGGSPFEHFLSIVRMWVDKMSMSMSPRIGLFGLVLLSVCILSLKQKEKFKHIFWLIAAPIVFLLLFFRGNYHLLIGYETLIYVLVVVVLAKYFSEKGANWVRYSTVACIVCAFIIFNVGGLQVIRITHNNPTSIQKGFLYADQLQLIERAYELSEGKPFSIGTLTNPYGINVTWGYLFDYLGRTKYGYEPTFFGPDQTGLVGADCLERVQTPGEVHFAIVEPGVSVDKIYVTQFLNAQNEGSPSATYYFRDLQLLQY